MDVQAAAITILGKPFVVVLVGEELVQNAGEADMAIESFRNKFKGAPVVLMAQKEDGTPSYYGDQDLVQSLRGVPAEKMPWKAYHLR